MNPVGSEMNHTKENLIVTWPRGCVFKNKITTNAFPLKAIYFESRHSPFLVTKGSAESGVTMMRVFGFRGFLPGKEVADS